MGKTIPSILLVLILGRTAMGDVHYVLPSGNHVSPFTTWDDAATNIQSCIDAADSNDTVLVGDGVYLLSEGISIERPLNLQGANGANHAIVDGGGQVRCFHVLSPGVRIEGLTIQNGFSDMTGGGILAQAPADIISCRLLSNSGRDCYCWVVAHPDWQFKGSGGGVGLLDGGTISNCLFVGNFGSAYAFEARGGGAFVRNGAVIVDSTFVSNNCLGGGPYRNLSGGDARGGAIYCESNCIVERCTVSNNTARGGGPNSYDMGGSAQGGGIYAKDSLVRKCIILNNSGMGFSSSTNPLYGSSLGSGVYVTGGRLENCLIAGNGLGDEGSFGSGLHATSSTVYQCTIGYNGSNAVFAAWSEIRNTISYFNMSPDFVDGAGNSIEYTCASIPLSGTGNMTNNPEFEENCRLSSSSPCIDAGSSLTNVLDDLVGRPRPLDGNGDGVTEWDMGAYEFLLGSADSDHDGLTDAEESETHNTNPTRSDTDCDGMPDGYEVQAGCSPTNAASVLMLDCSVPGELHTEAGFVIRWFSVDGKSYDLLRATDLVSGFSALELKVSATPPVNTYLDPTATNSEPYFYRVRLAE